MTWDLFDGERRPGGAVSFAARVASAMGLRAAILTIAAADADLTAFEGHALEVIPASTTLTFEHRQTADVRELRVTSNPRRPLTVADLPDSWREAREVVLAPLLPDDIAVAPFAELAQGGRVWLLAQGIQRSLTPENNIISLQSPSYDLIHSLSLSTSVFLAEGEVRDWSRSDLESVASRTDRLVVTQGSEGARIHRGGATGRVAATPADALDTTGAGDVFATAFILAVSKLGLPDREAGRLASAYAAASVERVGPAPLPPLSEVGRRIDVAAGSPCV